jgi:hypothetical protein
MADVPDDTVAGCFEHGMERDGQLDGSEAPGKMTATLSTECDELVPQRAADGAQSAPGKAPQIARLADRFEDSDGLIGALAGAGVRGLARVAGTRVHRAQDSPLRAARQRKPLTDSRETVSGAMRQRDPKMSNIAVTLACRRSDGTPIDGA